MTNQNLNNCLLCADCAKFVHAIPKHPDPEVAFLGEVTKNDDPWASTVAMDAMWTQCRADVCFKLDSGADVTVIFQSDYSYQSWQSITVHASTKKLVGANYDVLRAMGRFNGRMAWSSMMTYMSTLNNDQLTSESEHARL